jgi:L-lactate dehydrogenase complex protein LldG
MQSSSREEILSRIKGALNRSDSTALRPDSERLNRSDLEKLAHRIREISREKRESLISQFEGELVRVGGKFRRCESRNAASEYICELAKSKGTNQAVGWNATLLNQDEIITALKNSGIDFIGNNNIQREGFINSAIDAGLGLSGVDYALAETGTLVLLAGENKARSASLLPPVHVALVTPDKFISGLDDLFPLLRCDLDVSNRNLSSAVTFITGPSRTADIELTLVVGVHGPQELHVILLDLE